jgi:hypothetical protein
MYIDAYPAGTVAIVTFLMIHTTANLRRVTCVVVT